jgi:hypothetical protein
VNLYLSSYPLGRNPGALLNGGAATKKVGETAEPAQNWLGWVPVLIVDVLMRCRRFEYRVTVSALYMLAAGVLAYGYFFDRSTCVWHALTGFRCPGCGMGHALLALAQGNVRAAWTLNPGSLAVAPILMWTGIRRMKERIE